MIALREDNSFLNQESHSNIKTLLSNKRIRLVLLALATVGFIILNTAFSALFQIVVQILRALAIFKGLLFF